MYIKLMDLISLNAIGESLSSTTMNIKVAFKVNQLEKAVAEHLPFYQEKIREILEKYGEKDENGMPVMTEDNRSQKIKPGSIEQCNKDVFELGEIEVEIPNITFNLEDFGNIEITPNQMRGLLPFIQEQE